MAWYVMFIPTWVIIVLDTDQDVERLEGWEWLFFIIQYTLAALWVFGKVHASWPVIFIPVWTWIFVSLFFGVVLPYVEQRR